MMAKNVIRFIYKGMLLFIFRLHNQGLRACFIWLYCRVAAITMGIPILKYSQITPEIYIGSKYSQRGKRILQYAGITSVVNLQQEFDDSNHGLTLKRYCYLPTVDEMPPTLNQLYTGVDFIKQAVNHGEKVYVHCLSGMGRAPTIVAAYFISNGFTIDESVQLIEKQRPFVKILPVQLERLEQFRHSFRLKA